MLKKYFWAINLLFIAGVAYLVTSTANTYVADTFEIPEELKRSTRKKAPGKSARRKFADYKVVVDRNVFNSVPTTDGTDIDPPPTETTREGGEGDIQPSDLKVKLIGTIVGAPENSYSVIEDLSTKKQDVYHLGDMLLNEAEIIRIERPRVILLRDNVEEELTFDDTDLKGVRKAATSSKTAASGEGIRQVTDSSFLIDEDEVEGALDNLNELLTQIRVVPNFENGKTTGFKVFAIRPDSIFDKIGLKNGDVIQRINDMDINSPEKAFEIFQQLKSEKNLSLDITRNGQRQSFSYEIR